MPDNFQLFRLSLVQRSQVDLFPKPNITERDKYLTYIFGAQWKFEHRGRAFHYLPDLKLSKSNALMGRFGRQVTIEENLPPDEGFIEVIHDSWKAAVIAVDPTNHEDGQKIAIQIDPKVGAPGAILESFIEAIASLHPSAPFVVKPEPIFNAATFWEFAEENRGNVTSINFEFVVPNGFWNADTDLTEELKEARQLIKAQKVSATFQSQDGLETDSPQIKEAVSYVENGSGEVSAKAKNGRRFSSKNAQKKTTLHEDPEEDEPLIVRAARHIAKVLGK